MINKRLMLLALLLAFGLNTTAQQDVAAAAPAAKGSIAIALKGSSNTVTASYTVSPAYPDNILLQIRPSSEFLLNAHIVDAKGKELMKVRSETVTGRYANSIDVSGLKNGEYFIELYGDSYQQSYRIPFTKSQRHTITNTK